LMMAMTSFMRAPVTVPNGAAAIGVPERNEAYRRLMRKK